MSMDLFPSLWAIRSQELESLCARFAQLGARPSAESSAQGLSQGEAAELPYELDSALAIIPVVGPMSKRGDLCRGLISMQSVGIAVRQAAADHRVRAILLDIDSPGGTVDGIEELATSVRAAAEQKPLYAFANGLMASAAYWLGACAREIAAPATAEVGSIGVLMAHWEISKLADAMGYKFNVISAGKYKAMGNSVEPLSDEARAYLQTGIDGLYDLFLNAVALGRGVDKDTAQAMADGKVFLAGEALGIGLIDRLESRESFINHIHEEVRMDLTTLKKEAPGALSEHRAEVEAEMKAEAAKSQQDAVASEQQRCIGLCSAILGEETGNKLASVIQAGFSPEQAKTLTALLGGAPGATQQPAAGTPTQTKMLEALQSAHGQGTAPGGAVGPTSGAGGESFDALVSARMTSANCTRAAATIHVARTNPEAHAAYLGHLARKES